MSKIYLFYLQMEQENGDDLKGVSGAPLQLIVPDGCKLERDNDPNENFTYTLTTPEDGPFKFRILPAIDPPPMPMPAEVILRAMGAPEGQLG